MIASSVDCTNRTWTRGTVDATSAPHKRGSRSAASTTQYFTEVTTQYFTEVTPGGAGWTKAAM
eukprot:1948450-Pyramimonas_sp.AAC.3